MKLVKGIICIVIMMISFQVVFAKGEDFSNLHLKDINGKGYSFGKNKKETYVKLWTSWCPVCIKGLEEVENLSEEENDFEVVTVVFPKKLGEKSKEKFTHWYNSLGYKNTVVLLDEKGKILDLVKLKGYPTSVILDKTGKVKDVIVGDVDNAKIKSYFSRSMKKQKLEIDEIASSSKKIEAINVINQSKMGRYSEKISVDQSKYPKLSKEELKKKLTEKQYNVTQFGETERPFENDYWNFFEDGIYVDITTGEPLFSSNDKYYSKCGWPAFTKPIVEEVVTYQEDKSYKEVRVKVISRSGRAYLGHVSNNGPKETGGKKYCVNSAAIDFIPLDKMEEKGYGYLIPLVKPKEK